MHMADGWTLHNWYNNGGNQFLWALDYTDVLCTLILYM